MALIKELNFGKTKVEVYSNTTPEERKKNLINLYNIINEIANKKRKNGENVDNWFYTQEELEETYAYYKKYVLEEVPELKR